MAPNLPTYIPLEQAAEQRGLTPEALHHATEHGLIQAVRTPEGNLLVAVEAEGETKENAKSAPLPTYISLQEAVERYDFTPEVLRYAIEHRLIRAARTPEGNLMVSIEDIDSKSAMDESDRDSGLSTYIPVEQAAQRYNISAEVLRTAIQSGTLKAIKTAEGDKLVASTELRSIGLEIALSRLRPDEELRGKPIRLSQATRRYNISDTNLVRWAEAGYIRVLERGPKLLMLDEADVKIATSIFERAREATGSPIRAGWVLKKRIKQLQAL